MSFCAGAGTFFLAFLKYVLEDVLSPCVLVPRRPGLFQGNNDSRWLCTAGNRVCSMSPHSIVYIVASYLLKEEWVLWDKAAATRLQRVLWGKASWWARAVRAATEPRVCLRSAASTFQSVLEDQAFRVSKAYTHKLQAELICQSTLVVSGGSFVNV